ncbi:MAG: glycoside hydrolase family 127 protein [Lewinella sp.]
MTRSSVSFLLPVILLCTAAAAAQQDYPITPVSFSEVRIQDDFWQPKIRTNHEVTIPIAIEKSQESGRIDNFRIAANQMEGQFCTEYPFDDSDIYKIIEAASYSLQTFPDTAMEARVDTLIELVAAAQEPDGYLYTTRTIGKNVHPWAGDARWELVHELSHELYNLGHLYEAAVAHYRATGKRNLLDVAIKSADLVDATFGDKKLRNYPGHQEVELGLVKLFRVTGEQRYLDLAKFFLDVRGRPGVGNPKEYDQSHLPVTEQSAAVGHAVRGAYMWTAMADVAAITGDSAYRHAIDRIWHDIVDAKYYLNGGIGATGSGEAFGSAYELPNMSAYAETCAGVGVVRWNHRLFLMTGESKYIDVLERSLYNNVLDGVSLSGDHFFYPNPLASMGQHERREWFGCACCPPNVARTLPSMPEYIYAFRDEEVYVNMYVSSETEVAINGTTIRLQQETGFPWAGTVRLTVDPATATHARIRLRVPGYVRNAPTPGDLYRYTDAELPPFTVTVNESIVAVTTDADGYLTLDRTWQPGDRVEVDFPFPVHTVQADSRVSADSGRVAYERGPLVYAAEWADNDGEVLYLIVDENEPMVAEKSDELGGVYVLRGAARSVARQLDGTLATSDAKPLTLIPYHLWNNRGPGEMAVWLPTTVESAQPAPAPTLTYTSTITSSLDDEKSLIALRDQLLPEHSNDHSIPYLHWWPRKNTREWVQLDLPALANVSKVSVYWFDDGPNGGCRIPADWKVEYRTGDGWAAVVPDGDYPISKDELNTVTFSSVQTDGIRLLVDLPEEFAAGLYEVVLE